MIRESIKATISFFIIAALSVALVAHAAIVPSQNQLIVAPYGGFLYATSSNGTAKVSATTTPFFAFLNARSLFVSSTSTLGYASSTALTVSGNTWLTYASSTGLTATNANLSLLTLGSGTSTNFFTTNASGTRIAGFGLTDCDAATNAVTYDVTSQLFGCNTISVSSSGGSNWTYNGSRLTPSTTVGIGVFASSTIGNGTGAGGLTIDGGATTTGDARIAGELFANTITGNGTAGALYLSDGADNSSIGIEADYLGLYGNGNTFIQSVNTGYMLVGNPDSYTTPSAGELLFATPGGTYKYKADADTLHGIFDFTGIASSNKTFTFPNLTGTMALLENAQTFSGLKTFSAGLISQSSTTIGNGTATGGLTVSGSATSTNMKVTSLTASRAIFTDSNNLFTTTGSIGNLESSVGSVNILLETEIDGCSELLALLDDETGTCGGAVFSTNPLLAGFRSNASSTIGGGTAVTGLHISGGATTTGNHIITGNMIDTNGTSTVSFFSALGTFTNAVINTLATIVNATITGVLTIPNGTGNTANDPGEIAHDTSDNQLIMDDYVIRTKEEIYSFSVPSTSPAFATSSVKYFPVVEDGYVVSDIYCSIEGGTSKPITLFGETITCDADGQADDGAISIATVAAASTTAGGGMTAGAGAGVVNWLNVTVTGRWTRE